MLSKTQYAREFQNNTLWYALQHAPSLVYSVCNQNHGSKNFRIGNPSVGQAGVSKPIPYFNKTDMFEIFSLHCFFNWEMLNWVSLNIYPGNITGLISLADQWYHCILTIELISKFQYFDIRFS